MGHIAPSDCWDQHFVKLLTSNRLSPTGLNFTDHAGYPNVDDGCILVVPGAYWVNQIYRINEAIERYRWVLLIKVSDEYDRFDIARVVHPNIKFWVQTPAKDYGDARLFGCGFPPHFNNLTAKPKDLDLFLSAQRTHIRRDQAFDALEKIRTNKMLINQTEGFTRGLTPTEYVDAMLRAKVAPAPSGVFSPDSFRLYEALEAGVVPIADDVSPQCDGAGYWKRLFPDAPFPVLTDYADLPSMVDEALSGWPGNAQEITAWWARQKHRYAQGLVEDLEALGAL